MAAFEPFDHWQLDDESDIIVDPKPDEVTLTWIGPPTPQAGDIIDFTDSHGTLWRATVTGTEPRDPDRDDRFTIPLTRVDDPQEA